MVSTQDIKDKMQTHQKPRRPASSHIGHKKEADARYQARGACYSLRGGQRPARGVRNDQGNKEALGIVV